MKITKKLKATQSSTEKYLSIPSCSMPTTKKFAPMFPQRREATIFTTKSATLFRMKILGIADNQYVLNSTRRANPDVPYWNVKITFSPKSPYAVSFVQPITGPFELRRILIFA